MHWMGAVTGSSQQGVEGVLYLEVHDSGHCSVTQLLTLHFPDRKRSCLFSPFSVQPRAPIEFSEERKVQYGYKLYYYIIGLN